MSADIEKSVRVGLAAVVGDKVEVHGRAGVEDVTAQTPFAWGSITKTVTGTMLAQLAGQKVVRLDQPLSELVPGAPDMTLEALATHRSGLPRLVPGVARAVRRSPDRGDPYAGEDEPTVLAALTRTRLRRRRYLYSNHGFGLLGLALAKAAGTSYGELVQDLVARPLGLPTLTVDDPPGLAVPHNIKGRAVPVWHFGDGVAGCGVLRGSVLDLSRWLRAALGEAPEPLAAALVVATTRRGDARGGGIGLGWHIGIPFAKDSEQVLWHNGAVNGSVSFGAVDPTTGKVVALLANSTGSLDALGLRLLRAKE